MTPYMKTIFQQKKKKWNFDQNQWVGPLKRCRATPSSRTAVRLIAVELQPSLLLHFFSSIIFSSTQTAKHISRKKKKRHKNKILFLFIYIYKT